MTFILAHLSDPHLPFPDPGWSRLNPKQILALLSWRRKRRLIYTAGPLAALLADLAAQAPDHVALTGDLINLASPREFQAARAWLAGLGDPAQVTLVPGNHDLIRVLPWGDGLGRWAPWLQGDRPGDLFPSLRRRGPLAIIGLSSAVATPIFSAAGALGPGQLARLGPLLDECRDKKLFRVVLIHHPPVIGPGGARKALRDRAALCDVLRREGAELVLHGHHHATRLTHLPGPRGPIPVFGVASASIAGPHPEPAGWHLHRIDRDGAGWRLTTIARRYDKSIGGFRKAGAWTIQAL